MSTYEVPDVVACAVCHHVLINPVTLSCQHTFCRHCVDRDDVGQCPYCQLAKVVPPSRNATMEDMIRCIVGDQQYTRLLAEYEDEKQTEELRAQLKKQIRQQIYNDVYNEVVNNGRYVNMLRNNIREPIAFDFDENIRPKTFWWLYDACTKKMLSSNLFICGLSMSISLSALTYIALSIRDAPRR